jgi:hypothetical protein
MAAFDHGIKIIARTTGRQLARLAGIPCKHWEPAESTLQATVEKLADRVFLARQGKERFVVYFEFYTTWDPDAPWDMLAKSGMLSQREKLPTCAVAVVLRPQGFKSRRLFRLSARGKPTQALWYEEVCLWKMEPEPWWEKVPGLMALYPLCRHNSLPQDAIVHAAGAIEHLIKPAGERADLLTVLGIFSRLGYPDLDPYTIIGREKMQESKFYQEIKEEGALEGKREAMLVFIEGRFGPRARKAVAAAVDAVTDPEEVDRLLRLAGHCETLEEFRAGLAP